MLDVSGLGSGSHSRPHLIRWLTLQVRSAGDCINASGDAEACWRGWHVARCWGGLARSYRNPEFDRLFSCPRCAGSGDYRNEDGCRLCDGTGRLARNIEADCRGVR